VIHANGKPIADKKESRRLRLDLSSWSRVVAGSIAAF
jgi:hypothetical protein